MVVDINSTDRTYKTIYIDPLNSWDCWGNEV